MKQVKFFYCLFLSFSLLIGMSQTSAQNCRIDSSTVMIHHGYRDDFSGIIDHFDYSTITYFDLDSGLVVDGSGSILGYWKKTDTLFDANGRLLEILVQTGSSSGWQNYSSTTYAYTSSGAFLNQVDKFWNGSAWDTLNYRFRDYDSNGWLIRESSLQHDSTGWKNIRKVELDRTGGFLHSKTTFHGTNSTWVNDTLFQFSYQGNLRNSLSVSLWDTISTAWLFVDTAAYDTSYGSWVARVQGPDSFFVSAPTIPRFTSFVDLDTTEECVRRYLLQVDTFTSTSNFIARDDEYAFIAGVWRLIRTGRELKDMYCYWDGQQWYPEMEVIRYTYDTLGRNIRISGFNNPGSHGGGPYYTAFTYDSIGNLINTTYEFQGGVYSYSYYAKDYSYHTSSQVDILTFSDEVYPFLCPSETDNTSLLIVGGCQPYRYQWTPSIGLSSDTVRYPEFSISDTATYQLTVTDAYGRQATKNLLVTPARIEVDSSLAPTTYTLNAFCESFYLRHGEQLEWYYEGVLLETTYVCSLSVTLPGHYTCRLSLPTGCYIDADTVLLGAAPIISNMSAQICAGENYWLPDSTSASYSGVYFTRFTTPTLQDSIIITQLIVHPAEQLFTYESTCSTNADTLVTVFVFANQFGCDSTITHTHYIHPEYNYTVSASFCRGDSLQLPDGSFVTQDGLYPVSLQTQQGCDSIIQYQVQSDYPLISALVEINDTLFVTSPSSSFEWFLNGVSIGTTAQGVLPVAQAGYYEVIATDTSGCVSDRVGVSYNMGLVAHGHDWPWRVYPNPVDDILTVETSGILVNSVSMFDASGRCVKTLIADSESVFRLSLSDLSDGCYILVLCASDGKVYQDDVVVKH